MTDWLIERLPYANCIMFGLLAWWMAFHLPLPRWWATR